MKVEKLMTRNLQKCTPEDTLEQAARLMWEADVGCLPVVDDDGRPVGMITDRDVCMAAYTQGSRLRDSRVESAMSRSVTSCAPDASIGEVEELMRSARVRRVPVVDFAGSLIGVVTVGDIARYALSSPLHAQSVPGLAKTLASITEPRASRPAAAE